MERQKQRFIRFKRKVLYSIVFVKIIIGTVIRIPEMLNFVPDHVKTKKMYKDAVVNKLPYLLRYDQCLIKIN